MTIGRQDFGKSNDDLFVVGDDKLIAITVEKEESGPISLQQIRWWAKKDGTTVIQKDQGSIVFTELDDDTFLLEIPLAPADTLNLETRVLYEHECEVIDGAGKTTTVTKGVFVLTPQIVHVP